LLQSGHRIAKLYVGRRTASVPDAGVTDAEILAKEFCPEFSLKDLVHLPNYHIYLKLMIDGAVSKPFSAETILGSASPTDSGWNS